MSGIDKEYYQQQYVSSLVRTNNLFQANVERWNRKKDQQLAEILSEHAKRAGTTINPEVSNGEVQLS